MEVEEAVTQTVLNIHGNEVVFIFIHMSNTVATLIAVSYREQIDVSCIRKISYSVNYFSIVYVSEIRGCYNSSRSAILRPVRITVTLSDIKLRFIEVHVVINGVLRSIDGIVARISKRDTDRAVSSDVIAVLVYSVACSVGSNVKQISVSYLLHTVNVVTSLILLGDILYAVKKLVASVRVKLVTDNVLLACAEGIVACDLVVTYDTLVIGAVVVNAAALGLVEAVYRGLSVRGNVLGLTAFVLYLVVYL